MVQVFYNACVLMLWSVVQVFRALTPQPACYLHAPTQTYLSNSSRGAWCGSWFVAMLFVA